jgi:hypothetical protein
VSAAWRRSRVGSTLGSMWERPATGHTAAEPIEIMMTVTSVETPGEWLVDDAVEVGGPIPRQVDPALLPRQGTGTWPNGERAVRLGNAEEILITLSANPFSAMNVARAGRVFDPEVRHLRVDTTTRRDGDFELSWNGALRAPIRWRKVSLRLYASPSLNVTVMTIVPERARKISSRSFVRVGLRSARELASRIEAELVQRSNSE